LGLDLRTGYCVIGASVGRCFLVHFSLGKSITLAFECVFVEASGEFGGFQQGWRWIAT
jgi:hypothetical protein